MRFLTKNNSEDELLLISELENQIINGEKQVRE